MGIITEFFELFGAAYLGDFSFSLVDKMRFAKKKGRLKRPGG